ncbi:MAG: altronate dehydratase [Runella slithyformis]|nr:MAG: altronate dehydratase [Runella slithyformis]
MQHKVLKVHPNDNVIVALRNLAAGEVITHEGVDYELPYAVAAKHKFVTQSLATNSPVIMYGVLVGKAKQPIQRGETITTFNLQHDSEPYSTAKRQPYHWTPPNVQKWQERTFKGYRRQDGKVGTYNYWLVLPLVFCENRNILILKDAFERELGYAQPETYRDQVRELLHLYQNIAPPPPDGGAKVTPPSGGGGLRPFLNIDGIKFLTHEGGCGGTRHDANTLCALFAAYAVHPNVAGITVLSLGCQHSEISTLKKEIHQRSPHFEKPLLIFEQQDGTEYTMLSQAVKETFLGLIKANQCTREDVPLSELVVGLKCGGSDGFSGISANPVLGEVSDILVTLGAKTILAEFPELHGVEQELLNRCVTEEKAAKFEKLMRDYSGKAEAVGSAFAFNPSPGNIKDGLITDAIKSAGAAKKGGTAPIQDVTNYTEISTERGLQLACTPGNDVEATTGKTAAGATIIVFTTGLGTPTGNPICPVMKVATNTALAERMPDVIDFDCGTVISGEQTIAQNADELLELIIKIASGEQLTQAQRLGQDDFIPWKRGVSL